jgi:signal transduction histidine kinase
LGENFSGYLNKYDTRIFTFNSNEQPLFNDDSTSFNTLNAIYNLQSKQTSVNDWRFYEEAFDKFNYIARRVITDSAGTAMQGYLFVISKPLKYGDDTYRPELFSKQFNYNSVSGQNYAYAVYKNGELISSFNDYSFPVHLPKSQRYTTGYFAESINGFSLLWYSSGDNRTVLLVKRKTYLQEAITLFAYLFLVFLFLWATYRFLLSFIKCGLNKHLWKEELQLNFRSQVQTTIVSISIFSFIVIGVSTIFFFINRHNRTNKERLSRTIQIMQGEVENALQQHATFDDVIKIYEEVASADLQYKMDRISEIHGVEVNVYDTEGNLRVSSQPYYYNKGLLSRKMNPLAYYKMQREFLVQTVEEEKVGTQSYLSIYAPVRDQSGITYAYVNIPYFTSQNELKQEISSFLVTLINLNAFIFLIAGLIAYLVTNRITGSFTFISEKMKEMKLGTKNEAIVWNRKDEIGELVQEYNRMVQQLEESASLLAKSEREDAWREMARQVAHEIKNPLTPMKLSIQYLQKAIESNAADTKIISQNVAKTLVEQIDYLSNIASDFSNFANIANPRIEKINLAESLKSVIDLFMMGERTQIRFTNRNDEAPIFVMGDKTQLNRLFTNLVRNAIDAVPEKEREAIVTISYRLDGPAVLVEIADNGTGINSELHEKIFNPNFTTKNSGTGLGLAMCKGIVEQMKGDIWFETRLQEGTTFFVWLPIHKS